MSSLELAQTVLKHARSGHTEAVLAHEVVRLSSLQTTEQLRAILAHAVKQAGSAMQYAKKHKLTVSQVGEILRSQRPISQKIAQTLGYTRQVVFFKDKS